MVVISCGASFYWFLHYDLGKDFGYESIGWTCVGIQLELYSPPGQTRIGYGQVSHCGDMA